MFNKVKDVLQIKSIENYLGRKLTCDELTEIDIFGEVTVTHPNGDWNNVDIVKYSLAELLPMTFTTYKFHEGEPLTPDQKSVFTPKISSGGPWFTRQEFSFNPEKIEYFENVLKCLAEMEIQGKMFDEPTDQFIMDQYYLWGETDDSIAKMLRGDEGRNRKLKAWSRQTVTKRRKKITEITFGIKPMTIFR